MRKISTLVRHVQRRRAVKAARAWRDAARVQAALHNEAVARILASSAAVTDDRRGG